MKEKGHRIARVEPGSIAEEMEIEAGDRLLEINGQAVEDVFDYQYLTQDDYRGGAGGEAFRERSGCWRSTRNMRRILGSFLKTV